jgi:DNA-binding CsgD family transcriptional regulator
VHRQQKFVATAPAQDRVEEVLDRLRRTVPYSAALVTVHDPRHNAHVTLANRGYSADVVSYVLRDFIPSDPSFRLVESRPADVLHRDTLPVFRRSPIATDVLIPSGFRQGSSMVVAGRDGRTLGTVHVSLDESLVTPETLNVLAAARRRVAPLVATQRMRLGTSLSARELEVLRLVCAGLSNTEIAAELWITRRTVATHVEHILRKLYTANRVQAAVRAVALGLVSPYPDPDPPGPGPVRPW